MRIRVMKKNFCVKFILSYEFEIPIFCMTSELCKLIYFNVNWVESKFCKWEDVINANEDIGRLFITDRL